MAKVKIIPLTALIAVFLVSCDLYPEFISQNSQKNIDTLQENEFYAQNMITEKFYKVPADRLYEGQKCVIWAEKGSGVTKKQAQDIAKEYDEKIRPKVVGAFSRKNFHTTNNGMRYDFADMLDFANYLAGRDDQKLTILLLDIKDGYKYPENNSYVAGYFFGGDLYQKGKISSTQYSNGRDMIYIDIFPGLKNLQQTYATFAHELQHLINYVTSIQMSRGRMDIWVDEGLSSQAEYLYLGKNPQEKCDWFSSDPAGTIAKGNNFFVWGNNTGDSRSILYEYATVYLFFRWLYLQADTDLQKNIFMEIVTSSSFNYQAVTGTAGQIDPEWESWEPLLRTWLAANYYPKNTYGYTGDKELQDTIKVKPLAGNAISLYPGEGVYSVINGSFSKENSGNIRYTGLGDNTETIGTSSPYTGDTLLTFNANTSNTGLIKSEVGALAGVSPSTPSRMAGGSNQTEEITGPYVIDARDLLGRDSW
jgi:hypothetical protein